MQVMIRQISAFGFKKDVDPGSQSTEWISSSDNHLVTTFPSSFSSLLRDCILRSYVFLIRSSTITPFERPILSGTTRGFPFQARAARRCSRAIFLPYLGCTQRLFRTERSHEETFCPPPGHRSTLAAPVSVPSGLSEKQSRQCASMTRGEVCCQ